MKRYYTLEEARKLFEDCDTVPDGFWERFERNIKPFIRKIEEKDDSPDPEPLF